MLAPFLLEIETGSSDWQTEPCTGVFGMSFSGGISAGQSGYLAGQGSRTCDPAIMILRQRVSCPEGIRGLEYRIFCRIPAQDFQRSLKSSPFGGFRHKSAPEKFVFIAILLADPGKNGLWDAGSKKTPVFRMRVVARRWGAFTSDNTAGLCVCAKKLGGMH